MSLLPTLVIHLCAPTEKKMEMKTQRKRERETERREERGERRKMWVEEIDSEPNVERYPFVVNAWNGQHKKAIIFIYLPLWLPRRSAPSFHYIIIIVLLLPLVESKFRSFAIRRIFYLVLRIYSGALSGSRILCYFMDMLCSVASVSVFSQCLRCQKCFQYLDRLDFGRGGGRCQPDMRYAIRISM